MGIRLLTAGLRPYASSQTFKPLVQDNDDKAQYSIIIDGPAFAYFIYKLVLSDRSLATDPSKAFPSFEEVGIAAVEWLDRLRHYGIFVSRIFFDGFLPDAKKNERASRLQKSIKNLVNIRCEFDSGPWHPNHFHSLKESNRPVDGSVRRRLRRFNAPHYLVAAISEALRTSNEYGSRTHTIPGEADAYCADYARDFGGIVLTNDSDLLVHDLGVDGSVILFDDVNLPERDDLRTPFKCLIFQPVIIAQKLGLSEIKQLAFAMIAQGSGVQQSLSHAKQVSMNTGEYEAFSAQFDTLQLHSKFGNHPTASGLDEITAVLQSLDAQISEIVHQYDQSLLCMPDANDALTTIPKVMYLPPLLEDYKRTTAWIAGQQIRALGYSLLGLNSPNRNLSEMRRNGVELALKPISLFGRQQLEDATLAFLNDIKEHFEMMGKWGNLSESVNWQLYGAKMVCEVMLAIGKPAPSRSSLMQFLRFEHFIFDDWAQVHLEAFGHAALYSIRIFKQILLVFLASPCSSVFPTLEATLQELQTVLVTFPCLSKLFTLHAVKAEDLECAISQIYTKMGIEAHVEAPSTKPDKGGKKKKKTKKASPVDQRQTKVKNGSSNMYDLLLDV
ncbi:MAG: hypothetical protein M1820_005577 [Bogoriella megaspora]|nr:MAG: hypothetical protein M1820_005577 [Bogoriella megaspora]